MPPRTSPRSTTDGLSVREPRPDVAVNVLSTRTESERVSAALRGGSDVEGTEDDVDESLRRDGRSRDSDDTSRVEEGTLGDDDLARVENTLVEGDGDVGCEGKGRQKEPRCKSKAEDTHEESCSEERR